MSNSLEQINKLANNVFHLADADKSGSIDVEELDELIKKMAQGLRIPCPPITEIQHLLEKYDDNGDGVLQLDEFTGLVRDLFSPKENISSDEEDDDGEDEEEDDEENDEMTDSQYQKTYKQNTRKKKDSFSNFIHDVQRKKLSCLDDSIINLLMQQQKRQSRISISLDTQVQKLQKDLESVLKNSDTEKQIQDRNITHYQQRKLVDKQFLEKSKSRIVKSEKHGVSSVYCTLSPHKKKQQEKKKTQIEFQIDSPVTLQKDSIKIKLSHQEESLESPQVSPKNNMVPSSPQRFKTLQEVRNEVKKVKKKFPKLHQSLEQKKIERHLLLKSSK